MKNISKYLSETKRIGVFLEGELVAEYPFNYVGGVKALSNARDFTAETGAFHEVKIFDKE